MMNKKISITKITKYALLGLILLPFIFCKNASAAALTVSQDGTGNFSTIQEAVNFAADGDTINIGTGIYKEAVIINGKTLNLVGTGTETCKLTYPTKEYLRVPLFIQSGTVKNMTIHGYGSPNGYTIHIDNPYQSFKKLTFSNCNIIAQGSESCLGIGMYGGSNIYFNNCRLTSDSEFIFYHNNSSNNYPGSSSINFNGCIVTCSPAQPMRKQVFDTNNTVTLNLKNTLVNGSKEIKEPLPVPAQAAQTAQMQAAQTSLSPAGQIQSQQNQFQSAIRQLEQSSQQQNRQQATSQALKSLQAELETPKTFTVTEFNPAGETEYKEKIDYYLNELHQTINGN